MIALNDVCKSYQEGGAVRSVLDSVNLRIDAGEFVAIQGSSGSGKSTLLNIVAGLDLPDSGAVGVGGAEIGTMSEQKRTLFRRKNIGFVFQFFSLIPTLTVAENVGLGLELNNREAELAARVSFLLENIGLADRGNSYPDRLSGGEQQRVAIARAIAHEPPLILADEPTGNLDASTATTTLGLLERLLKQQEVTLVVATHSTEVACRADRVLQLRELQCLT
jgi:putative ABC transport system ATP-binding protein